MYGVIGLNVVDSIIGVGNTLFSGDGREGVSQPAASQPARGLATEAKPLHKIQASRIDLSGFEETPRQLHQLLLCGTCFLVHLYVTTPKQINQNVWVMYLEETDLLFG